MLRLLCIVLLSALVSADTPYENCGGATKVVSFQVDDCKGSPCTVHKGQPFKWTVVIIPDRNSAAPTVRLSAVIQGAYVELESFDCSSVTSTPCSLEAGVQKTIVLSFEIPLKMQMFMNVKILDDQDQLMTCLTVLVNVE